MQRLTRMDGLRGLLAIYVMLGHALPLTDVPPWVTAMFGHGEAAVDLFFALSGLVVINGVQRCKGKFWLFMEARARRLLPVYFLVLAAAVALLMLGDPLAALPWVGAPARDIFSPGLPPEVGWHVAAHVLLVHGLIPRGVLPYAWVSLLGPAWSLSAEWQFYVLLGLLAPKRLAFLAYGLLAAGVFYQFAPLPAAWQFSRAFLPSAAPWFALGLASHIWLRGGGWGVFGVCLAGACALESTQSLGRTLIPLLWGVALMANSARWGAVLETPVARYLGAISYPLYLVNVPCAAALALLIGPMAEGNAARFTLVWLPCTLALSVAAAAALHHLVARRFTEEQNFFLPVIARPLRQ